ncbi:hypothetical protein HYV49_06030 [Candidatus Pacearchaeota archaeon]|nr:hypothetical protein [Candidatus Pacearchaeota archaeon]
MRIKSVIFSIFIVLAISYLVSAQAFNASISPSIVNRTESTRFNVSITAGSDANITLVQITLGDGQDFISGSNLTTATAVNFTNVSTVFTTLIWNTSQSGFQNATTRNFLFNATATRHGDKTITINVSKTAGANNVTTRTITINFEFSGYVKNETAGNVTGANVTVYQFIFGQNGPPTENAVASVLTDNNGSFNIKSINGSDNFGQIMYTSKIIFRNETDGGNAKKVSSVLPPFPANMYYPQTFPGGEPQFEFMKPPALNGSTFYLQAAATLRLNATNGTLGQKFGYMIMDQLVGFPIVSNIQAKINTIDIVVPTGRSYTVMFMREFSQFTMNFSLCDGKYMNDTLCPSPPISNSSLGSLTEGGIVQVTQDLSITKVRLTGCINIASGANNTLVNITNLIPKLMPWTGFVPPINADFGDINITRDINYTSLSCSYASYNISVIGSASGLPWLIELYAKNASNEAGNPGNSNVLAGFQNVTITASDQTINITLYRLTGTYWQGGLGKLNTSTIRVNIQNSTGGALTTGAHIDIRVKNPVFGTLNYIIDDRSIVNGTFYIPILNNSNYAKIKIFANDAPPKEVTLNLSKNENNITLVTMSDGRDAGFKKVNETGDFVPHNISSIPIDMRFLRYSNECNVINPPSSCEITSMNATSFNPFKALVAGRINMEMKIRSTNVTLMFVNFDMFSAKQPPMESIMEENASTGSNNSRQIWEFGSFVPSDVYDYVLIGMSYSDTSGAANYLNESLNFNMSIPILYDENWKIVWNSSRGDTSANLTDDFIDYNNSALYRNYLTSGGANCSTIDSSFATTPCHHNTTLNIIFMKIPKFSGIGPQSSGSAPAAAQSSNTTTTSTTSGSTGSAEAKTYAITTTQFIEGISKKLVEGDRIKITAFENDTHYVKLVDVADDVAEITVSSLPVTFFLKRGEVGKADFNDDGYYDVQVLVESLTNKTADVNVIKIYEKAPDKPANQTITGGAVAGETTQTGEQNATTEDAGESFKGRFKKIWPILLFIAIFLILAGLIVAFIILKKKGILD